MTAVLEITPNAAKHIGTQDLAPAGEAEEGFRSLVLLAGLEDVLAQEQAKVGGERVSLQKVAEELAGNLPPGFRCSTSEVAQWLAGRLVA